jgi:surface protein
MYGDINSWDVSAVTNMNYLFFNKDTFNSNISAWDVSKVTSMDYMFALSSAFNQNISAWDIGATSMRYMFYDAIAFNEDISTWDVSRVTSMRYMFLFAEAFNQNLCAWGCKLPAWLITAGMFLRSDSCPAQDDPSFDSTPPGPFCYSCTSSCLTRGPTAEGMYRPG